VGDVRIWKRKTRRRAGLVGGNTKSIGPSSQAKHSSSFGRLLDIFDLLPRRGYGLARRGLDHGVARPILSGGFNFKKELHGEEGGVGKKQLGMVKTEPSGSNL